MYTGHYFDGSLRSFSAHYNRPGRNHPGIPTAGHRDGLYGLVGHCVNLLPMRSKPEGKLHLLNI
jgi:hypothetical protein